MIARNLLLLAALGGVGCGGDKPMATDQPQPPAAASTSTPPAVVGAAVGASGEKVDSAEKLDDLIALASDDTNPDWVKRVAAIGKLSKRSEATVIPALKKIMMTSSEGGIGLAATAALCRADGANYAAHLDALLHRHQGHPMYGVMEKQLSEVVRPAVVPALGSDDPKLYDPAYKIVLYYRGHADDDSISDAVAPVARDPARPAHKLARGVVTKHPSAAFWLTELEKTKDPAKRREVAKLLYSRISPAAVPKLLQLLDDPEPEVRAHVAAGLFFYGEYEKSLPVYLGHKWGPGPERGGPVDAFSGLGPRIGFMPAAEKEKAAVVARKLRDAGDETTTKNAAQLLWYLEDPTGTRR